MGVLMFSCKLFLGNFWEGKMIGKKNGKDVHQKLLSAWRTP
jgi:hypothetical protein